VKRERMLTNACKALAKHWLSRHHPMFGAAYILDAKVKSWHPRQQAKVIGRMYFVSPSKGE